MNSLKTNVNAYREIHIRFALAENTTQETREILKARFTIKY